MKKMSDMTGNERIAYKNIRGIFNYEIGGWVNCIYDHCPEYIPDTIEEAKQFVYEESLVDAVPKPGWYRTNAAPLEMRFAGEAFIRDVIDHLFKTDGDAKWIAEEKGW